MIAAVSKGRETAIAVMSAMKGWPPNSMVSDTGSSLSQNSAGPAAQPLRLALGARTLRWLATAGMRDELARVLGYPQIARRLPAAGAGAGAVLAAYDALTRQVSAAPPRAEVPRCKDPDDQPFIDLAVAHRALLLSKDGAVLGLSPRLRPHGVRVASAWPPAAAG